MFRFSRGSVTSLVQAIPIVALVLLAAEAGAVPVISATSPVDQTVGVPLASNITVSFSGPINASTINADNLLVTTNLRGKLTGSLAWSAAARRLTFDPAQSFLPGERVLVTVTKGVKDLAGMSLPNGHHFQFAAWTAPMPDGSFTTSPTSWPIGSIALSCTVGDLDGDALPEAVFANVVPDSLTVLSSDGSGTLFPFASLATHPLPRHSILADVDEDGLPDIVCAGAGDTLDVFRNLGTGAFVLTAFPVTNGTTPYGAFGADLDADGDTDVALANFNGHSVSVLENQGDGTFAACVEYSAGTLADSPRFVDGADFDGDGDVDLACCNGYSHDVSVFLNDGNAAFDVQEPLLPVGQSPNFVDARDYDGDGLVDLVTINSLSEDLSFLRGNGDGTFQPVVGYGIASSFPFGIHSVDVDGDGDLDAVVPVRGANGWLVMDNDGAGSFTAGPLHSGGIQCHSIGAADWDLDGDIDVVAGFAVTKVAFFYEQVPTPRVVSTAPSSNWTGTPVDNDVTIFFSTDLDPASVSSAAFEVQGAQSGPHTATAVWNGSQKAVVLTPDDPFVPGEIVSVVSNGSGLLQSTDGVAHPGHVFEFMTEGAQAPIAFVAQSFPLPGVDPVAVEAADLDGDHASDLIVANYLSADVTLLLTAGDGLPITQATLAAQTGPLALCAADLDGNGHVDVAVANAVSMSVSIQLNSGGASFSAGTPLSTGGAPFALRSGDFDRDGDIDLAVAEVGPHGLRVFWNDGSGAFPASSPIPVGGSPVDLAVADLDLDGDLDIVAVDAANSRMEALHYQSGSGFASVGSFGTGGVPVATFPWDTDGDGWVDLVSSDWVGGGVSVLQSLGDGAHFAPAVTLPAGAQPHGLWGGDVTGDGRLDLVTANSGGSTVTVFAGQGGGLFDAGTTLPAGSMPYGVVGGDWNGDGVLDVAAVNRASGDLTLFLNGVTTSAQASTPAPARCGLLAASPNPSRGQVAVEFALAGRSDVALLVYDLRGRAVATLLEGGLSAGVHRVDWDGRDRLGAPVAAGVYFVRLNAEGQVWNRKLLRLR
ncbi:MAG: FG-GAP-like repeat-containing protein [Candidatus Eiseniibacteriota bacterium]